MCGVCVWVVEQRQAFPRDDAADLSTEKKERKKKILGYTVYTPRFDEPHRMRA